MGGGGAKAPLAPPWIRACVILYINTISIKGILCEVSYLVDRLFSYIFKGDNFKSFGLNSSHQFKAYDAH